MSVDRGTVLAGRYEVVDRIAEGGMSTVYRARRLADGHVVALKVLRSQFAADSEFIERFAREARAAETLQHPHIVQVFESGRDGDIYFIAMEYVDGSDLKAHLRRLGRLDPKDAERIATAVCEALDYAHRAGIIHRDIKPQNILLTSDGTVKVADFGIARAMAAVTITQPGTVLGTVQYLAPEQVRGAAVGRASDLYSLGVVLYEMLTGRLPFEGDTPVAIALKHLHDPLPSPRAVQPDVPLRLEGVIRRALAKRSEDRYRSAREMATDLTGETAHWKVLSDEDEETTRRFEVPADATVPRDSRAAALRLAIVVAAVFGVGLWAVWQAVDAYLTVPEVEMPALVGRPLGEAEILAREVGLVLEVSDRTHSPTVPADVVLAQEHPPGKRLKQGRQVGVVVSLGPRLVMVPNVLQRSVQDATLALDNAGLKIGALHDGFDEVIKPGHVIRQEPPAGMAVPADSPVTLLISRGPPLVEMPALVGKTLEEARRLLEERGLVITYLRRVGTDQAEPGLVLEQAPGAAARVRPGEVVITVTISVRSGEEGAPPKAPVITAEPQPAPSPTGPSTGQAVPTPRSATRPTVTPGSRAGARAGLEPIAPPTPATSPGQVRRTRIQVLVPEGGPQEVRIVVIDETGVRTVYHARHVPGDRIDQTVQSQGYTIIQVYLDNRLVQEVRP